MTDGLAKFVDLFAVALEAIVPAGVSVSSESGNIVFRSLQSERLLGVEVVALIIGGDDPPEGVLNAVEMTLSNLQDFVSESTAEPWPRRDHSTREIATPSAVVLGEVIRAGYRTAAGDFSLALEPLPIP
jgi:hypothetical protein